MRWAWWKGPTLVRFQLYNRRQSKFYYALSKKEAGLIRLLGFSGLLALIALTIGFIAFAIQSWAVALMCIPFFLVVILYHLINFALMSFYPGFDTKQHRQAVDTFKNAGKFPRIAVFIPAAGEDLEIVDATVKAALKIRYPNFTVHVLDDSTTGMYEHMAKSRGAHYFRRRNTGHHKKAGNLNAAMAKLRGYDHILVLDADFVPRKEILEELVPYTGNDVGIVQSPQHFDTTDKIYYRSKFEFGAALIQKDFYRITQVARNRFGGAICVGTNALYSVKALKKVGGYEGVGRREWGHSEDVHTGLKMLNTRNRQGKNFKIVYVPIQLAKGMCPPDHLSFYKQQNRWSTGSIQLAFSRKTLFSRELSLVQKLCYFSNSLYYLYTIGLLFSPIQLLVLMLMGDSLQWMFTLLFIPMLVVTYVLVPFVTRRKAEPLAIILVTISNAYTFAQAIFLLLLKQPLGWEATGLKGVKKRDRHFSAFKIFGSLFFVVVYISTLAVLIINQRLGINPSTFIVGLFTIAFVGHLVYLYYMLIGGMSLRQMSVSRHFYTYAFILVLTITTGGMGVSASENYRVGLSQDHLVALYPLPKKVEVKSIEAEKPSPIVPIKAEPKKSYEVVAKENESQSELAMRVARDVAVDRSLDRATTGKLQDKLMHAMGYTNAISVGATYTFSLEQVDELLHNAYVYDHEVGHWSGYATQIGI